MFTKQMVIDEFLKVYKKILKGEKYVPIKFQFKEYKFEDNSDDAITINVVDSDLFFTKLQVLLNLYYRMDSKYEYNKEYVTKELIHFLWLRMQPDDFNDIYGFLDTQISFLLNTNYLGEFDKSMIMESDEKYTTVAVNDANLIMFESFTRCYFRIHDNEEPINYYELPSIHYGIKDEDDKKVCYLYGIQNMAKETQDKKIARSLYKINKDFPDSKFHPSFVLSMKLMIDLLLSKGITSIKVPLLEVLNYSYHEKLSDKLKTSFKRWEGKEIEEFEKDAYEKDLDVYNKYVDREDEISKAKVENFAYLFYRIQEQYGNIDIDVSDYMLTIRIKGLDDKKM